MVTNPLGESGHKAPAGRYRGTYQELEEAVKGCENTSCIFLPGGPHEGI